MPIEFDIHGLPGLIVIRLSGDIGIDVMLEHIDQILADPHHQPGMNKFVIFHDSTSYTLTADQERRFASRIKATKYKWGTMKSAVVAKTDLEFGMARMYAAHVAYDGDGGKMHEDFMQVSVFRELYPALDWLGITSSALRKEIHECAQAVGQSSTPSISQSHLPPG